MHTRTVQNLATFRLIPRIDYLGMGTTMCRECERLLAAYTAAAGATRSALTESGKIVEAGVEEENRVLDTEAVLEQALSRMWEAREALYVHQLEQHGTAFE